MNVYIEFLSNLEDSKNSMDCRESRFSLLDRPPQGTNGPGWHQRSLGGRVNLH
jgi:hypothetical protein